jgi:hypothetical protein
MNEEERTEMQQKLTEDMKTIILSKMMKATEEANAQATAQAEAIRAALNPTAEQVKRNNLNDVVKRKYGILDTEGVSSGTLEYLTNPTLGGKRI